MSARQRRLELSALALLSSLAAGCAPEFAKVSEIETLRVLGVKKDKPYAAPGEEVTLSMLWDDGSPDEGRPIKRAWLAGVCSNPVGDSFIGCFQAASDLFGGAGGASGEGAPEIPEGPIDLTPFLPEGDSVTFTVPEDIISEKQQDGSLAPGQLPYGLSMVFFFACAGENSRFVLDPSVESLFPIICEDEDGNALGSDDYVAGYTSIYSYEEITNDNPVVTGFEFRGAEITPDCIGTDCITAELPDIDCGTDGERCVPVCEDDGDDACPKYEAQPIVDQELSVEPDEVAKIAYDNDFQEQIWINYYVDHGSISPDVKLVNDATKGWNPEYFANFRAPKDPGLVSIWALVHDNRGGVEFARFTIKAE